MKFVYFTDLHLRARSPMNRIDKDYYSVQFDKLNQIKKYIEDNSIKNCFIGGDIFDAASSSIRLLIDSINFFRELSEICTIYIVPGNHDIVGGNLNSLNSVFLGVLLATRIVHKLDSLEKRGVYVKGIPYRLEPDMKDYKIDSNTDCKKIIISHDMITPSDNFPFEVLPVASIDTNADVVLGAHYHQPYVSKSDGTIFINPGSLMRLKLTEDNLVREPSFLYMHITQNKFDYEVIKLDTQKGKKVFNVKGKKELKENQMQLENFFSNLSDVSNSMKECDVEAILEELKKGDKINSGVFKEAMTRIQEAKKVME